MKTWLLSAGLSLVITMLGAEQELGEPGFQMGRDEAVAAIRELGGGVRYDEKSPESPIVLVDLVETDVVDADLVFLKGMTHLRTLYLNGTRVTDAGMEHLKGLTNLHLLMLYSTRVTDAGVNELKRALPKCQVLFLSGRGRPMQGAGPGG